MQRGPKFGFSTQQSKLFFAMKERYIGRTYTEFQRIRTKEHEGTLLQLCARLLLFSRKLRGSATLKERERSER